MSDIVPNLLRLSSEVDDVADLFDPVLDLVLTVTGCDAAAFARATPPNWSIEAARNVARTSIPLELAAEAIERGNVAQENHWLAAPLISTGSATRGKDSEHVLLVRGKCTTSQLAAIANRVAETVTIVERQQAAAARVDRLQ